MARLHSSWRAGLEYELLAGSEPRPSLPVRPRLLVLHCIADLRGRSAAVVGRRRLCIHVCDCSGTHLAGDSLDHFSGGRVFDALDGPADVEQIANLNAVLATDVE